jgi:alkylated DNA repair dioxygenase AlkB
MSILFLEYLKEFNSNINTFNKCIDSIKEKYNISDLEIYNMMCDKLNIININPNIILNQRVYFSKFLTRQEPRSAPVELNVKTKEIVESDKSWCIFIDRLPLDIIVDEFIFQQLWDMHPKEYAKVIVYNKEFNTPRFQQTYGKSYNFSGVNHKLLPFPSKKENEYLFNLVKWVNLYSLTVLGNDVVYNQMMINWYQDGNHYIGAHSDSESDLTINPKTNTVYPIFSFSFGAERVFKIILKKEYIYENEENNTTTYKLKDNSLIIMGDYVQKYFKHSVPKIALSKCSKPRINITFRVFN